MDSIYTDPLHYDLLAQMTAPQDLPFYERLLAPEPAGARVLELGCGSGRLTLPLAAAGYALTGVDQSQPLLQHAQAKALGQPGSAPRLLQADFCALELGERFDWVLVPYNAFNHLLDLAQQRAFFAGVQRHLRQGGRLVIDTLNPDPAFLGGDPELQKKILSYRDPYREGATVELSEQNRYNAASQVNHITWRYHCGGELVRQDELAMRMFFPQELDTLVQLLGFRILRKLGTYAGDPFGPRTPKQLLICAREDDLALAGDGGGGPVV